MFISIFIFAFVLLAGQLDYLKRIVGIGLFSGLVVKMIYEEGLLCKHFPAYTVYMEKTKRVIPFVW